MSKAPKYKGPIPPRSAAMIAAVKRGWPVSKVAEDFGVTKQRVWNVCYMAGYKPGRRKLNEVSVEARRAKRAAAPPRVLKPKPKPAEPVILPWPHWEPPRRS